MEKHPPRAHEDVSLDLSAALPWTARLGIRIIKLIPGRSDPALVLRAQEHWRRELRENLDWPERDEAPEVMLVRMSKRRRYPADKPRLLELGASDAIKFEVKSVSDRYLEVYSRITMVEIEGNVARETHDPSDEAVKAFVVGKLPLERIGHIDWEPDPASGLPRIYFQYGYRGPIEKTVIYTKDEDPPATMYELYRFKFKPIRRGLIARFKENLRDRKSLRLFEE